MRALVYGCGAIGSLLVHAFFTAGNEATVISRGRWKEILSTQGLHLKHVLQHKETIDHPEVAEQVTENVSWDLVFFWMQGWQKEALLDTLAGIHGTMLVLIGNNPLCQEMKKKTHGLTPEQKVLFGFQSSAGGLEEHAVQAARKRYQLIERAGMKIRPAEDEKYDQSRVWAIVMDLMLYGMAKTGIGEYCISDHCRNAVEEMEWMDQ
ncbi:ketopantoate reductase family protein [Stecheria intestinalis]|uniref:ketopantoate reductase family protein n=1 Tax=Stecheria intestinalis TaxID=2606630 RepID=UPI0023F47AD9|nr:2-dehydropantoate 2-reductase N-terminal domain-containing protein [Stecheria intestinalis]MDD5882313.1 2-dehydropantoate 2-reductase N-terminal domain-containing protein [Stecheria intestinalis]